ncbi:MAG TPA: FG-GAP-like repeat-containing protein [Candidatus Eisenbacteria bacterium]
MLTLRTILVPAAGLLLAAAPVSAQTFTTVFSPTIGSHVSFSTGATWVDVDDDGDLDIYVVTGFAANNDNVLWRNNGDGTFDSIFPLPITSDAAESACGVFADRDNDGDVDGFVSNLVNAGGMLFDGATGGGTPMNPGGFTLNTTAGSGGPGLKGTGAAWGDYDNDGHLDLVIAALFNQGGITTANRLFHNNGDGTFSEVTTDPVVTITDSHHHPTWADYDGDGDIDLFFGTGGPGFAKLDRLYRNQLKETGTATFTPITSGVIATDTRDSQLLSWVDYDNDGDLDMYAVNYSSVPNQLYRNDGGTFTKITTGDLVTGVGANHGVVWGDFDNDGDPDAYVARDSRQSNRYFRNNGNGTFTRITAGPHVNEALSNYGAAAGDYDRDGDLDLFVPTARSETASQLFRNDTVNGNHWITLRCRGTISNRSGVGAVVRVKAVIDGAPRWQRRDIATGTSYGGSDALEAHFGLGTAAVIESLRVDWPSGLCDVRAGVAVDQYLTIVEDSSTPVAPSLVSAVVANDIVHVEWRLQEGSRGFVVQRALDASPFEAWRSASPDADGRVVVTDDDTRPGRRQGYRLVHADGTTSAAAWVTVEARLALTIVGSPRRGGTISLLLSSIGGAPAEVELLDVAGRRRRYQRIEGDAAGQREVALDGNGLPAGVYFVQVRQGGRDVGARLVLTP